MLFVGFLVTVLDEEVFKSVSDVAISLNVSTYEGRMLKTKRLGSTNAGNTKTGVGVSILNKRKISLIGLTFFNF